MQVYAEVVVLINFLVDFLLLLGAGRLSGLPVKPGRAALGALLGGLYALACLLPGFSFLGNVLWGLVFLAGMVAVAYGIHIHALRQGLLFFLLSMALGGLASGIGGGSFWVLLLTGAGLWLLCRLGFGGGKPGERYLPVRVSHRGKELALTALVDTGNTLTDPVSGCPVLVADSRTALQLLGLEEAQLKNPLQTLTRVGIPGLRLIPYHAVGTGGGFLLGIRPEKLICDGQEMQMVLAFAPDRIGENKVFNALAGGVL